MATAEKLVAVAAAASEVVDWALAQSSGGCADAEGALSPVPIADRDCGFIFSQTQPSLDLFTVLFARPPQSLQVRRARTVRILLRIQGGGKSPPPRYNSNCTKERSSSTIQVPATIAVAGWIWLWAKLRIQGGGDLYQELDP